MPKIKISSFVFIFCCWMCPLIADQIDIGIFESAELNNVEVRIKPNFEIQGSQTITAIRYTLRWTDPGISFDILNIPPFYVQPIEQPVLFNDHYYQIFLAVPQDSVYTAIEAGQERSVSSFSWTGNDCGFFEIIEDEWTQNNNGGLMLELQGTNITGTIYEPIADMRSVGGTVTGGGTIDQGDETGDLVLESFSGDVLHWQKKHNDNEWQTIAGTEGKTSYKEIPATHGRWLYQAAVKRDDCEPAYASPAEVLVVQPTYSPCIDNNQEQLIKVWVNGKQLYADNQLPNPTISLFNTMGQINSVFKPGIGHQSFPLNIPGGIYYLVITDNNQIIRHKKIFLF